MNAWPTRGFLVFLLAAVGLGVNSEQAAFAGLLLYVEGHIVTSVVRHDVSEALIDAGM
jgi:hypothetical protein